MIKCVWVAPTKHTSGRAVKAGDLTGFSLRMKVEGAPAFTEIAKPAATVTSFEVDANDPGTYQFELVALSSNGKTSAPATGSVTIVDTTPLEAPALTVSIV
jgi:hypothetical protein